MALLNVNRLDDAAVELMTGFIVTGDEELRRALIALYRNGLDAAGCATTVKDGTGVAERLVRNRAAPFVCGGRARDRVATRQWPPGARGASLGLTRDANCGALGTP